ncbi:MAG: transcriptional regulator NrdR [Polyangiaceae bacterium]|nr:transcriptional regulator NrdR [Polyangiaceae bacterium]MCW5791884.1 transcriptional regulator NrdR [Polyangiaceae bacterium]
MQCPFCTHTDSRVVDSRLASGGTVVWRRRECDACHKRFTTYERVEHTLPTVVKKDGRREPFDRSKLLRSLQIACNKRPVAADQLDETAEALERTLGQLGDKEIPARVIGERVMEQLKELDEVAYVRFASVYRSFRDIDEFMAEMGKLVKSREASG